MRIIKLSSIAVLLLLFCAAFVYFSYGSGNAQVQGRFGTCAHPFRSREINIRGPLFDSMKDAGVQWLRIDFEWKQIEPKKGVFDFKLCDEVVSQLENRKIKILGVINGSSSFGNPYDNTDEWLEYVKKTVEHFKGRVDHWEIINEHNIGHFGKRKNAPEEYGAILKRAYAAVHSANPNAVVLYGGLAGVKGDYAEKTLKVCGTDSFDIMNFHAYPGGKLEKTFGEYSEKLRELMKKYGVEKPIWITETGATTPCLGTAVGVLRPALIYLNIKDPKIFGIKDGLTDSVRGARELFPKAEKVGSVGYAEISKLGKGDVIVLPISEVFPYKYADDLVDFVKKGGTLVYQGGGYPFCYDESSDNKSRGSALLYRLHADLVPYWAIDKNIPSKTKIETCSVVEDVRGLSLVGATDFRCLDYRADKLKRGDKFVPLVKVKVAGKELTVAAIYKLGSDMRGNLILVSTNESNYNTEAAQAAYLSRAYLFAFSHGIDKVFIYNFRSHGEVSPHEGHYGIIRKDMSHKPAFRAYQTVKKLLGDSAKPTYSESDGLCRVQWKSPDGRNITALWTLAGERDIELTPESAVEVLDVEGKLLKTYPAGKSISVKITPSPTYVVEIK